MSIKEIASRASAITIGLEFYDIIPSMAWLKASMPVKAVGEGGREMVTIGSIIARSANMLGVAITDFPLLPRKTA